uniref:Uncharacterized protein n=1 Tax=Ananas comosus var. bracteatus TaxID=296719 RepID=A0A6V7Q3Z9_ANACO|nr:unnamed protein product [Ananas comosus var. bracteatus]
MITNLYVRTSIPYRTPLPTVDVAPSKLIAEETSKGAVNFYFSYNSSGLATSASPRYKPFSDAHRDVRSNLATPTLRPPRDLSQVQCNYCKQFGHTVKFCTAPTSRNM